MGNICSFCFKNRTTTKSRPQSLQHQESSGLHQLRSQDPSPVSGQVSKACSQSQIAVTKTETFSLLTHHPSLGATNSSSMKSEKKSLVGKLSGSLHRNNSESHSYSESKIVALFEKYKDEEEDCVLSEGIEEFCMDLQLKPDEFKVLVLAWQFGAEQMCRFTRTEFINGCKALKTDSCKGIQTKLPELVAQVAAEPELFKDLYKFTFKFGLDSSNGQRILPIEMAVSLWLLVFSQNDPQPPILKRWLHFLEKHPQVRGIPRDTWNMFLNFVTTVGNDLTQYDDTEAWPSLFDDFVEFENDQLNQNSSTMQDLNLESSLSPNDIDLSHV